MTAEAPDIEYTSFSDEPVDAVDEMLGDSAAKPDAQFLDSNKKRSKRAERYEEKIKEFFQVAIPVTMKTNQADTAALIMYGPDFCEKWGDLADVDARVRKGIDFFNEGTSNPYLAAAAVTLPMLVQILRNHEKDLEVKQRGIRIPFTQKRFGFKFGVKLGFLHHVPGTNDPEFLKRFIFEDEEVIEKLGKLGIKAQRQR